MLLPHVDCANESLFQEKDIIVIASALKLNGFTEPDWDYYLIHHASAIASKINKDPEVLRWTDDSKSAAQWLKCFIDTLRSVKQHSDLNTIKINPFLLSRIFHNEAVIKLECESAKLECGKK